MEEVKVDEVKVEKSEMITVGNDKKGLNMIQESCLTEQQKKLAQYIYDTVKKSIESYVSDVTVNNTIKITKTIAQIIKHLEQVKLEGKPTPGADKKAVTIELGRILIKEVMPDDKGEDEILMVYDMIAEPTLETMIEVSKVANVMIQEIASKCCPSLFEMFKRAKKISDTVSQQV